MNCINVISKRLNNIELVCCDTTTTYVADGSPVSAIEGRDPECPLELPQSESKDNNNVVCIIIMWVVIVMGVIGVFLCMWRKGKAVLEWIHGRFRTQENNAANTDNNIAEDQI